MLVIRNYFKHDIYPNTQSELVMDINFSNIYNSFLTYIKNNSKYLLILHVFETKNVDLSSVKHFIHALQSYGQTSFDVIDRTKEYFLDEGFFKNTCSLIYDNLESNEFLSCIVYNEYTISYPVYTKIYFLVKGNEIKSFL